MEEFQLTLDWANRNLTSILFGVLAGIIILFVGRWLARLISRFVERWMRRAEVDEIVVKFAGILVYSGLLITVIIAAMNAVGIHTNGFVILLAAVGVALGLAVKDSLASFASGVMILLTKPYALDDFIDTAGATGIVEEVGLFSTVLRTPDNLQIIVPNARITNANIKNYSVHDKRRIDLVSKIGYQDNIGQARDLLMDIMTSHPLVLAEPAPIVEVTDLGQSSVNLAWRPWTETSSYGQARSDILEQMKQRFDETGISLL